MAALAAAATVPFFIEGFNSRMNRVRTCWNYKSRAHPDVPCTREAQTGDYCSYHTKYPHRFSKPGSIRRLSKAKKERLRRFIRLCRVRIGLLIARRQGLLCPPTNQTELITLEPIATLYPPYRFSFCEKGLFWSFDVRALVFFRQTGPLVNPYTRNPLTEDILAKLQTHVQWLNRRHYSLDYSPTPHQTRDQRITELCLLMDRYGYWTNVAWFSSMTVGAVHALVNQLDLLWMDELGLTDLDRQTLYPLWNPAHPYLVPLIRGTRIEAVLDQLLTFLFSFLTNATVCVYVLKALATVSSRVRAAYPWLLE